MRNDRKLPCRFSGVATTPVRSTADIRSFFDRCASSGFSEQHGHAERLLDYRLGLVRTHARLRPADVVLDVACGNGHHLEALAPEIARGVGIDLSPAMIDLARLRRRGSPWADRLAFEVDDAESLAGVAAASMDLALCIGAFEHVLDKPAMVASIHRVLRPGGRFFCLTPDGSYLWYRAIAPLLGLTTKHLSSDRFLTRREFARLLEAAGFRRCEFGSWTFIPRGDMPPLVGALFQALDRIGRITGLASLRGGLWACAWRE
jgi:ubiquinone/menaquinone biosynthesis C-methylase UbiE